MWPSVAHLTSLCPRVAKTTWAECRANRRLLEESALVSAFISGRELSRLFYEEAVRPILDAGFPAVRHSAALLGRGSEVLGFDDEMSTDHDWKPRALIFLAEEDERRLGAEVRAALQRDLPATFAGRPTGHAVHTVRGYLWQQLELDIDHDIEPRDWLTLPEHGLRAFT